MPRMTYKEAISLIRDIARDVAVDQAVCLVDAASELEAAIKEFQADLEAWKNKAQALDDLISKAYEEASRL